MVPKKGKPTISKGKSKGKGKLIQSEPSPEPSPESIIEVPPPPLADVPGNPSSSVDAVGSTDEESINVRITTFEDVKERLRESQRESQRDASGSSVEDEDEFDLSEVGRASKKAAAARYAKFELERKLRLEEDEGEAEADIPPLTTIQMVTTELSPQLDGTEREESQVQEEKKDDVPSKKSPFKRRSTAKEVTPSPSPPRETRAAAKSKKTTPPIDGTLLSEQKGNRVLAEPPIRADAIIVGAVTTHEPRPIEPITKVPLGGQVRYYGGRGRDTADDDDITGAASARLPEEEDETHKETAQETKESQQATHIYRPSTAKPKSKRAKGGKKSAEEKEIEKQDEFDLGGVADEPASLPVTTIRILPSRRKLPEVKKTFGRRVRQETKEIESESKEEVEVAEEHSDATRPAQASPQETPTKTSEVRSRRGKGAKAANEPPPPTDGDDEFAFPGATDGIETGKKSASPEPPPAKRARGKPAAKKATGGRKAPAASRGKGTKRKANEQPEDEGETDADATVQEEKVPTEALIDEPKPAASLSPRLDTPMDTDEGEDAPAPPQADEPAAAEDAPPVEPAVSPTLNRTVKHRKRRKTTSSEERKLAAPLAAVIAAEQEREKVTEKKQEPPAEEDVFGEAEDQPAVTTPTPPPAEKTRPPPKKTKSTTAAIPEVLMPPAEFSPPPPVPTSSPKKVTEDEREEEQQGESSQPSADQQEMTDADQPMEDVPESVASPAPPRRVAMKTKSKAKPPTRKTRASREVEEPVEEEEEPQPEQEPSTPPKKRGGARQAAASGRTSTRQAASSQKRTSKKMMDMDDIDFSPPIDFDSMTLEEPDANDEFTSHSGIEIESPNFAELMRASFSPEPESTSKRSKASAPATKKQKPATRKRGVDSSAAASARKRRRRDSPEPSYEEVEFDFDATPEDHDEIDGDRRIQETEELIELIRRHEKKRSERHHQQFVTLKKGIASHFQSFVKTIKKSVLNTMSELDRQNEITKIIEETGLGDIYANFSSAVKHYQKAQRMFDDGMEKQLARAQETREMHERYDLSKRLNQETHELSQLIGRTAINNYQSLAAQVTGQDTRPGKARARR